jgi:hypothetical protein
MHVAVDGDAGCDWRAAEWLFVRFLAGFDAGDGSEFGDFRIYLLGFATAAFDDFGARGDDQLRIQ